MTGQVGFKGSAESVAFAPLQVEDQTQAEKQQLGQRLQWMKEDNNDLINQRIQQGEAMKEDRRLRAAFAEKDMEQLAEMSTTIGKSLMKWKEQRDIEDEAAGESLAYQDGISPERVQAYREDEAQLKAADGVIQETGDELQRNNAPFEIVNQVRNLSGRKLLGYQKGKAKMAAVEFQTWLPEQLASDDQTQITVDGITFTPATAEGSAQKQAAAEMLRQKYMAEKGLLGLKPEFLNETIWPTMKSTVGRAVGEYTSKLQRETQEREQGEAISRLTLNVADDPTSFGEEVQNLRRNGLSSSEAIKRSMDTLQELVKNGKLTEEQYLAVKNTVGYDGKTTWGELRAQDWIDAENRARDAAQSEFQRDEADNSREQKRWSDDALRAILADPNIRREDVEGLIRTSEEQFGSVDSRLKDALQNRTLEARSEKEQREYIDSLVSNNRLTFAELTSGKYSADVVKSYTAIAQQQDNARAPELREPKATSSKALESALKAKLGVEGVGDVTHHSLGFALQGAKSQVDIRAMNIAKTNGGNFAAAYQQATLEVIAQIEKGQGTFSTAVNSSGVTMFSNFSVARSNIEADRRLSSINAQVKGGGAAAVMQRQLMTKEELQGLSDPNSPIPPLAQSIANSTNGKMNAFEVIDAQLRLAGLPPRQRPFNNNLPNRAPNPEIERLRNFRATGPQVRRSNVMEQGDGGPPGIAEWRPLLNLISKAEAIGGSYDTVYGGVYQGLSQMTIAEADRFQQGHARRTGSAASGRYQFMNIKAQAAAAGIGPNELFSPANQDRMAVALITGKRGVTLDMVRRSPKEAMLRLSQEWAGLPRDSSGKSYYHGDGRNKATVNYSDLASTLSQLGTTRRPSRDPGNMNPVVSRVDANRQFASARFERTPYVTFDSGQPGIDVWIESKKAPAVLPGVVIDVSEQGTGRGASGKGYGKMTIVRSIDPTTGGSVDVLYAHLDKINVNVGDRVAPGQIIGKQGGTGRVISADGTIFSIDFYAPGSSAAYANSGSLRNVIAQRFRNG